MKLFEHQKKGIQLLTTHDQFGLFWDMGSGKTLTMLIHLSNLVLSGEVEKILWLAPKSALGAVPRDLNILRGNGADYRADALENAIVCMNYEKLSRKDSKFRKLVEKTEWGAIVLDEAHCLAHPTSNRTKYIVGDGRSHGLIEKIPYRYVMTGTPVTNSRFEDFWSFMRTMRGKYYFTYREFEELYLKTKYIPGTYVKMVSGYKNVERLLNDVAGYSQSITKEECLDLPECMPDNVVKIPLNSKARSMYETAMNEDIIEATDEVFDNALVRVLRLRQIASGHIMNNGVPMTIDDSKCDYAMELIENNPHKTVVFYEFKHSFELLTAALKRGKIPFMFLNGEQPNKNIWLDFQNASAEECRVFLVQYRSGNAGIDLYTSSDTIFYEPCLSSTVLNQARSRTHRNGVSRACTFTFLISEGTVEEDIYKRLQDHEDFNEKLWIELKRKEYLEEGTVSNG